jgi:hypothetical protein
LLCRHCDVVGCEYHTFEKPHIRAWLLARTDAAVAVKRAERERLTFSEPSPGFVGTVSEAIDLIGQYQNAVTELLIIGDRNDEESRELLVSDVMPHFA